MTTAQLPSLSLGFVTWYAFRIEEEIGPKAPPSHACMDNVPASVSDGVWIRLQGGTRTIAGVTVRYESPFWPVPVRGDRYLVFAAPCSPAAMVLLGGAQSIFSLSADDRIEPNPIQTRLVQAINGIGSLANVRRAVRP